MPVAHADRRTIYMNATLYTPEGVQKKGRMIVGQNGTIEAVGGEDVCVPIDARRVDVGGRRILPGLIDLHVHGGGGYEMMDATRESLDRMSRFHAQHGTTALLATTHTESREKIMQALKVVSHSVKSGLSGAQIVGVHLEGPFIHPEKSGGQRPEHIRSPSIDELKAYITVSENLIRLVTMAPEIEGGMAAVRWLARQGLTVSIGHSNATFAQVQEAFHHGVRHTAHHFNAMSALHHREPGVAGAGLVLSDLTVELIADGIHVHPAVAKLLFDVKGPRKVCLVTDAVICAGLPDGDYGRRKVIHGQVYTADGSRLSGSSLTSLQAIKNAMSFTGYTLERILPSMTEVPAKIAGLGDRKGALKRGFDADFLIVDDELTLLATYVKGRKVHGK